MRRSRFSLAVILCVAALAFVVALPGRVLDFALGFCRVLFDPRPVADLFRGRPAFAFAGPPATSIDPALANEQRHEAGLARLGTVRHQ